MRRRCALCGKLTHNWERINGGHWQCYDGCYSTTGFDRRTVDGTPLWENKDPKNEWRTYIKGF